MKKTIFSFVAVAMFSTATFANTPTLPINDEAISIEKCEVKLPESNVIENISEDDKKCTVECSVTFADGTTVSATAGNIFSSCERAMRRCFEKMNAQLEQAD